MFGIQVSRAVVFRAKDRVPVIAMEHLAGREPVLEAWGYPRVFKVGDIAEQGMVVEINPPPSASTADKRGASRRVVGPHQGAETSR